MRLSKLALALASLALAGPAPAHDHAHMQQIEAGKPLSGASVYNLSSVWTDQDGKSVSLESLRGKKIVLAMAYTGCKDICPMIVANMVAIENEVKNRKLADIRFAFFSLDSAADTPARLKAYADERGLDPGDWTLYQGDAKAVRDLAAVLGVRYRADGRGGFDHAALITLLDEKGEIVFQQPDTKLNAAEFVDRIQALAKASR